MSITKPSTGPRALRVHVQRAGNKTKCGMTLSPCQEDLGAANCKRCLRAATAKFRQRSNRRLNGKKVPSTQTQIKL